MSKFTINNKILDVESSFEFPFLLKKNVFSQGEIGARGGVRGVSVKFPPTNNNFLIFDKNCEYDNNNKFYTKLTYNLIIETDRVIFRGQFYISEYSKKEGIKGFYISNLTNWVNDIAGKSLKDIQSFNVWSFLGMQTIIENNQQYLLQGFTHNRTHDFVFPLISYGTYFLPYWSKRTKYIDTTNYGTIINNPAELINGFEITNEDVPHIGFGDVPPSFYVVNVLKAIFKDIDWTVSGSFFNGEEAAKLIMPYVGDGVVYNWKNLLDIRMSLVGILPLQIVNFNFYNYTQTDFDAGYQYLTRLITTSAVASSYEYIDTGFNTTNPKIFGDFFVPEDGIYEFNIRIKLALTYGNVAFRPIFGFFLINPEFDSDMVSGQTKYFDDGTHQQWKFDLFSSFLLVDELGNPQYLELELATVIPPGVFGNLIDEDFTFQTQLRKGDIIRFVSIANWVYGGGLTAASPLVPDPIFSASIKNISGDDGFHIAKNLPDLSQTEFIESLINQFNLYFTTNDEKKVIYFEKRDNFYLQNNVTLDISEYCTIKDFTIIPNEVPERFKFTYAEDSNDYLNPKSEFEYLTIYQNQEDEKVIELPFAATRTAKFTTVFNTLTPSAANLQTPNFKNIKDFNLNIIAGEEQFNSVQFDSNDNKYIAWNFDYTPRILSMKFGFIDFGTNPFVRRWRYDTMMDDLTRAGFPTAEFLPLEWSELIANWRQFLFLIQHSDTRTIQVKMDSKLWNKIESNVPIRIKGDYYILQEIGEFRILQKNDIVELTLIKLYR